MGVRQAVRLSENRPDGGWMVAVAHFRKERVLRASLIRQGFEAYLPMRFPLVTTREAKPQPLFRGIVFVRVTPRVERWQAIFSTEGFRSLYMTGGKPIGLRDEFIQTLMDDEIEGYHRVGLLGKRQYEFEKGQKVQTMAGLVQGLLQETVDEKRATLLTSLMNGNARVTVDLSKLSAA